MNKEYENKYYIIAFGIIGLATYGLIDIIIKIGGIL